MNKLLKLFFVIFLFPSLTQACLWLEGTTIDGDYITFKDRSTSSIFLESSQHTTPKENFKRRFYRDDNQTLEYVALKNIMESNYKEGIEQLLSIEKRTPHIYATASNLGTAYELEGNNPLAIEWIKEGIKRNAESHGGTEWLHVLILETKLELENNATLLKNKHLIDLPARFEETTLVSIKGKSYSVKSIRDALFYQLKERLIFVKPKDEVVADLLYTFAKIEEQTTVVEEAEYLIDMAIEYGFDNQNEIISIKGHIHASKTSHALDVTLFVLGALLSLLLLNLFIKKKRKNLIKKPLSPFFFALSVNTHILLFTILFVPLYSIVQTYLHHITVLYLLLIPFYLTAIYLALQGFKERHIIINPKKSILYTILLYIGFIFFLYFKFLEGGHSDIADITAYFIAHSLLALGIFYFLRWRMR